MSTAGILGTLRAIATIQLRAKLASSSLDTAMSYVIQRDSSRLTIGQSPATQHRARCPGTWLAYGLSRNELAPFPLGIWSNMSEIPIIILKEGTQRSRGRDAQRSNIMAAKVLAETVRSTIGPRGMDKMMVGSIGDIVITNDGATIMKEMDVQNPAAKMLVEVAKTQDSEVGDGTTTAVVLAGELLSGAEGLLDRDVHPNVIIDGYRAAAEKAQEILDDLGVSIKPDDDEELKRIALTSLNTKGIFGSQEHFADLAVEAVKDVMEKSGTKITADIDFIKVMKK